MSRNSAILALAVLVLATPQAGAAGGFAENDYRQPIPVTPTERNQVLFDMRELLHGLFNIHNALAKGDMKAVAQEAQPMGELVMRMPEEMLRRMPEGFLRLGGGMKVSFDGVAKAAGDKGDLRHVQGQLAEAMTYCSGCHDTYRFQVGSANRAER